MMHAWATTKSNPKKYHAIHDVDGEAVAVCSRRIRPTVGAREFDPDAIGEQWHMQGREACDRCARTLRRRSENNATAATTETPTETAKHAGTDVGNDPTVSALVKEGFSGATHNLASMARIVRGWLADDVDVWSVDGMLSLIASKHAK